MNRRQNNASVKAVSPRHCPATWALHLLCNDAWTLAFVLCSVTTTLLAMKRCLDFGFCVVFSDDHFACYETMLGLWLLCCVQ